MEHISLPVSIDREENRGKYILKDSKGLNIAVFRYLIDEKVSVAESREKLRAEEVASILNAELYLKDGEKLRLSLSNICDKSCDNCCNKDIEIDNLERVSSFAGYKEIMLTGGEPMLDPGLVIETVRRIREETRAFIYIYTAQVREKYKIALILMLIDGLTVTLHTQKDVAEFRDLDDFLIQFFPEMSCTKSLRLNIFKGVSAAPSYLWKVKKDIVWIKNCPLPAGEVLMRL